MAIKTKKIGPLYKVGILLTDIEDGIYQGRMSGYQVEFIHGSSLYMFRVENGVRGINVLVKIIIKNLEIQEVVVDNGD